jgi:hypothetical protein
MGQNDGLRHGAVKWQTFYAYSQPAATNSWQSWIKPPNCSWIYMLIIAAGGGGGNGFTGLTLTARGGGGGGGSGGFTKLLVPAWALPDVLYVRPGTGGAASTQGVVSQISITPNSGTAANLVLIQAAGSGGSNGAATGNAAGGSAGAIGVVTGSALSAVGIFHSQVGIVGTTGGLPTGGGSAGTAATPGGQGITTQGTGGGGVTTGNATFAGGAISIAAPWPAIAGGVSGSGVGNNGFMFNSSIDFGIKSGPLFFSGGTGGGSGGAAVGGAGGAAAYGGGGGGGGGGTTGGAGGRGGDGVIVIGAW